MLQKKTWEQIKERVTTIADGENSFRVNKLMEIPTVDHFSENGLYQLGSRFRFPAGFVRSLWDEGHTDLATDIVETKRADFFRHFKDDESPLLFREFPDDLGGSKIYGVLSDRYSIFDDKEVVSIAENSDYLMNAGEIWSQITPEHFHCRFIASEKLTIPGDPSPLSMCVFVDNSMVGRSVLSIRFGLYRWACTNGVISGLKSFEIVRERHLGVDKSWEDIVAASVNNSERYQEMLLTMVRDMSATRSAIYGMTDEDAIRYIRDKLAVSGKKATEILDFYQNTYGGASRWDLVNAITDAAHTVETLDNRLFLEQRAMRVA